MKWMRKKLFKRSLTKDVQRKLLKKIKAIIVKTEKLVDILLVTPHRAVTLDEDIGDEGLVLEASQGVITDETTENPAVDQEVLVVIMRMASVKQQILKMSERRLNHEIIITKGSVRRRRKREMTMKVKKRALIIHERHLNYIQKLNLNNSFLINHILITEIAKKYPPSLRLIVIESKVSKIQVGHLYVVTYKGGSLGREGSHHHVLVPVEEVSKEHLKFTYNNKKGVYQFIEKSRNGTILNGKQVSLLKQEECEPQTLLHGDILEIGRVRLLAHVHEGLSTCNDCEPFNYAQKPQEQSTTKSTSDDLLPPSLTHKEQLKLLQKRYGLEADKYQEKPTGTGNKNYEDRASQRRKKVGSSHDHEKTVQASVNQSISSENKGFKMLAKMGWSEGAAIGKNDSGIKEPVQVKTQSGKIGLGHDAATTSFSSASAGDNKKKQQIWSKTQERYSKLKGNDVD